MNVIYRIKAFLQKIFGNMAFESFALLVARIALADIFWRSSRTKVEDGSFLTVSNKAIEQFSETPFNHVPIINGELGAYVTTYAETFIPIALFLGLFTRSATLALVVMALVIQFFVFPTFPHFRITIMVWLGLSFVILARGAGGISLDALLFRKKI